MRVQLSLYSGWLTAAFILNLSSYLKTIGIDQDLVNEEMVTIMILGVALCIYNYASVHELNPLYGAVYIWVLFAINVKSKDRGDTPSLDTVSLILGYFQILFILGLSGWCISKKSKGELEHGLFF